MKFIVGLNGDGWPTAIPLDRISELRIDPDDKSAVIEFRDDPTISYTLVTAFICKASEVKDYMMLVLTNGATTTTKTPIEDCGLSARSRKALWALGVESLEDAQRIAPHDILNLKGAGETTLYEIKKALGERGLALRGMALNKQGGGA